MDKVIGVVGLGIMGSAIAQNLIRAGYRVVGFDIARGAVDAFHAAGGEPANNPRDVASSASIIILSLPSQQALTDVCEGELGLSEGGHPAAIVVEMSTLPIPAKIRALEILAARGMHVLDCPISGTGAQARVKDLIIFGSGDEMAFRECKPVLESFSRRQVYLGAFGNGMKMKLIANHLVTIHNVAAGEAMALGQKAGFDRQTIYDALADSAGSSRMFQVRGPLMVSGHYDAVTATIITHLKDVNLITGFAREMVAATPLFEVASQYYLAALAQGWGKQDNAAVCAVCESLAGVVRKDS